MVKPEWGAKHGCPKCGTRFYDLGKDDPVTCIECGMPVASRAGAEIQAADSLRGGQKERSKWHEDTDLADEDLDIDEDGDSPDNDVDLGGDDDLGVRPAMTTTKSDWLWPGFRGVTTKIAELASCQAAGPPLEGGLPALRLDRVSVGLPGCRKLNGTGP
jgi:hypothetical protein